MKHDFIMLDYAALAAVAAVVREGSFDRAAAALGITPSAISQRVRGLEERMGTILIERGQPCRATATGHALCDHFDRVRLMEQDLAPGLRGIAQADGALPRVAIAVNSDSLATWFHAAVADSGITADIVLELALDDEAHTADRLRRGEVLAAVSADPAPVPGCRTIALGMLGYAACASPAFIARHFPTGVDSVALAHAPYLRFDRHDMLQARWAQAAHGADLAAIAHRVPSTHAFLDLALAGLGWGLQPLPLAEACLRDGRLVELPPARRIDVTLYWKVARLQAGALDRLTRSVRAAAARSLRPTPADDA
ncbi:MAG: LysR family transcriptional regulator ArgP [Sphingomonas fennica]